MSKRISITLSNETCGQLESLACAHHKSVSAMARQIMDSTIMPAEYAIYRDRLEAMLSLHDAMEETAEAVVAGSKEDKD